MLGLVSMYSNSISGVASLHCLFMLSKPDLQCPFSFSDIGLATFPYIVFRNRFLHGFMLVYMYIIYIFQDGGAVGFVDFTKLSFALSSLAQPFDQIEYRIHLRNTKPVQILCRTFSKRSGYWSSNRMPNSVAIGPAIGHVRACHSHR